MSGTVWERIEESRARYNVLEHPFYVRWSAGELTEEELARYAGPVSPRDRGARPSLRRGRRLRPRRPPRGDRAHAAEEAEHIRLWDDFVEAVGRRDRRRAHTGDRRVRRDLDGPDGVPRRSSRACTRSRAASRRSRGSSARASLAFYGIDGGPGSEYFRVHEAATIAHAEESRRLIEEAMRPRTRTPSSRPRSPPSGPTGACSTASAESPGREVGDRPIGILLGILLGIAILIAFLFLGSEETIDAPSISGGGEQTDTAGDHTHAHRARIGRLAIGRP